MSTQEEITLIDRSSIAHRQRNIGHRIIDVLGILGERHILLPIVLLVFEAAAFVLDLIGASFILSVIGFLTAAYSVKVSRPGREYDRNKGELVFSIVQLILTCVNLILAHLEIKFNPNIPSILPLVVALIAFVWAYKQNEPASSFFWAYTQNEPASPVTPDQMGVERGVLENNNVALSDSSGVTSLPVPNQSLTAVNEEETATTPDQMGVERQVLENNNVAPTDNSSCVTHLPVPVLHHTF